FVSYVAVPGVGQSQQAVTVGEGEAWILTDGRLVKGKWTRPDPKQPAVYTDANGTPVNLTPGRTWIELPQPGDAVELPYGADPASIPYPLRAERSGQRRPPYNEGHVGVFVPAARHRHLPRQAGVGGDAQGRRDHGRGHAGARQDRR